MIFELVNGPRTEKYAISCLEGLAESVVYRLEPRPVDVASGQLLPLEATQLTKRRTPLGSSVYGEAMYTLRFSASLELGSREE